MKPVRFFQSAREDVRRGKSYYRKINPELARRFQTAVEIAVKAVASQPFATIGFELLAEQLDKSSKSVHRMLSPQGNPTMDNLTHILVTLQKKLDFDVEVKLSSHNKSPKRSASRRLA